MVSQIGWESILTESCRTSNEARLSIWPNGIPIKMIAPGQSERRQRVCHLIKTHIERLSLHCFLECSCSKSFERASVTSRMRSTNSPLCLSKALRDLANDFMATNVTILSGL